MLYLFYGDNEYELRKEFLAQKGKFVEKNGEFNLTHIKDISEIPLQDLSSLFLSEGFMGEKKLILVEGIPYKADSKISSETEEALLNIIEEVPENNIVIFASASPDKRSKLFRKIKELSKLKEFKNRNAHELNDFIKIKYPNITNDAIALLVKYKGEDLTKITSELDKLFILKDSVDINDIKNHITPELDDSLFDLINNLLNGKTQDVIISMNRILNFSNVYLFYNSLIANLRNTAYILIFKKMGVPDNEISFHLNLGKRAFLINKRYNKTSDEIISLYEKLVEVDSSMKKGELIDTDEKALVYEIQKIILSF